jgi:outer membrane protein assembly factor BamB
MVRYRRRWPWLVAAVIAITAAACSSSDKSATNASSPSPSSSLPTSTSTTLPDSSSSGAPANATWIGWGHDATRSGVTDDGPSANGLQKVWTSPEVDGDVYAQPLVVGDLVIVATPNNSVYAFDVTTGQLRWQQLQLGPPVDGSTLPCGDVDPVGITSTPVADPSTDRLYVVGMVRDMNGGVGHHELFALTLDTGQVMFHHTVDAPGADPAVHNQRGALALANGRVYVPFGGRFGDCGQYQGRVVSLAADGSGDIASFTVRANREAGFWAPAGPVVAADGTLLVTSGNSDGQTDFDDGSAVIRLSPDLQDVDSFAPTDWARLNAGDIDLGTTSPALLDNNRIFQIGKEGVGYVIDASHMGGVGGELHQQKLCDSVFGGLAHEQSTVYIPCSSQLMAVSVGDNAFTTTWTANIDSPGPPIVVGDLVWVLDVSSGKVYALDKSSGQQVFTDDVGSLTHFSSPAAGAGLVVVGGGRKIEAYASSNAGAEART